MPQGATRAARPAIQATASAIERGVLGRRPSNVDGDADAMELSIRAG
jgi:hypothetical protein